VLISTNHPNIIKMFFCFRGEDELYFALEYASNGTLSKLLKAYKIISYSLAIYYTAELINALEYLHSKGIAHRDLKPENILLGKDFHLKIADFGTAMFVNKSFDDKESEEEEEDFVGTAEYVSPEVLQSGDSGLASDLWALGCIIYKFFTGTTPFLRDNEYLTFDAIANGQYEFPNNVPPKAVNLCKKLLVMDPNKRLGSGPKGSDFDYEALKKDPFFEAIEFELLHLVKPPIETAIIERMKKINAKKVGELDSSGEESNNEETTEVNTEIVDKVIKEGIINKKSGWLFYKKCKLELISNSQLAYYDSKTKVLKGTILLREDAKVKKETDKKFVVVVTGKKYRFEGSTLDDTKEWIEAINKAINNLFIKP